MSRETLKHPTVERIDLLIKNLKKIEKTANKEGMLNMYEGSVSCGAPACVGGWYAISTMKIPGDDSIDFLDGADKMAVDLGFKDHHELCEWADNNPNIWGNLDGYIMFSCEYAYDDLNTSKTPMTTVIDHWKAVKRRLQELT